MSLDLSKLVGLKQAGDKQTAQCPACAALGGDSSKEHLVIFKSGKYGCCVDQSPEHSKTIWRLVGDGKPGQPGELNYPETYPEDPQPKIDRTWPPDVLNRLVKDYSYWEKRGIREATIAPFKGGVATDGQMKDRWVIPIFNADQTLVIGFTGRCLRDMTKEERKTFKRVKWKHLNEKDRWVWGDLDEIESSRRAILVESPGDLLMLRQNGVLDVLCTFGTSISQAAVGALIASSPSQIIVSTNRDPVNQFGHTPGQTAALKIKKTLDTFFNSDTVEVRLPPEGVNDWGEATPEQIHATFNPTATPDE